MRSFGVVSIVYDATVAFCGRFLDRRSRTVDQMVQAARSGRQNIGEGSRASSASSQTELRLVNVARASLDELLLDYEDFLRQRNLRRWEKDSPEARAVREIGRRHATAGRASDPSDPSPYERWLGSPDPAVVANALLCLIHQANYLLDRQIARLEEDFVRDGGYTESLAAARRDFRRKLPDPSACPARVDAHANKEPTVEPDCPQCGTPMRLLTAARGPRAGGRFWGCRRYPDCRATLPLERGAPPATRARDAADPP